MNDETLEFALSLPSQSLALPDDGQLAALLDRATMERIQALLGEAVSKAEAAMEEIRKVGGPTPAKGAQELLISINHGAGYLRICRDRIEAVFREWAKVMLQQRCAHDHGAVHQGRRASCKICGWEFIFKRGSGWVPMERPSDR